jgi:hypothetical protein
MGFDRTGSSQQQHLGGFSVRGLPPEWAAAPCQHLLQPLGLADLSQSVVAELHADEGNAHWALRLSDERAAQWAPEGNTLDLASVLQLRPDDDTDLAREIVLALLLNPMRVEFPSAAEFHSAVRIRMNIVRASRKTMLAFHTSQAERPADCWRYDEDCGFVIQPQASLIHALIKATQPDDSGQLYDFSCYRASEYVIVLGIAQELERCNPALLERLQTLWKERPIKSGAFHDVFLRELGSMEAPVPTRFFVPGDRVWFRNPDEASADASGFEGSWVLYLGGGLFSNFWDRDKPYTLTAKCLEMYHWRHAVYVDEEGEPRIDECKVAARVEASLQDADEVQRIVQLMTRYREPRGIYTEAGGCMDTTREWTRWVRPESSDMVLPSS